MLTDATVLNTGHGPKSISLRRGLGNGEGEEGEEGEEGGED